MLSRTVSLFPRSLSGSVLIRWTPPAARLELEVRRLPSPLLSAMQSTSRPFSSSCALHDSPNKPGKSGDKGPQKNYKKKVMKRQKKEMDSMEMGPSLSSLLEEMKEMESQSQSQPVPAGHMASLMKRTDGDKGSRTTKNQRKQSGLQPRKTSLPLSNKANVRHSQPVKEVHAMDSHLSRLRGKGMPSPVNFTDPSSGKRLGLFNHPKPGAKIMPRAKPTLAEQDDLKGLQELFLLRPTTHYEEQMTDSMTSSAHYPRSFPVDNDDYFNDHDEATTGFEEHVLLDHLLEGFPKKGPVRHFMELVVTGLSKNPHYSASEKRQCVQWYRDYFNEFTSKELQSV